jgi:hypothetical protein
VPATLVVRCAEDRGDPHRDFRADDEGADDIGAAGAVALAQRQHGREYGRGRMAMHGEVRVVEVERVPGGAVQERCSEHRLARRVADDGGGSWVWVDDLVAQDRAEWFALPGEGTSEPVENAVAGSGAHVGWDVVVAEGGVLLGEPAGDCSCCHARALPRIRSLMMCCWIWLVPSKMVVSRASRQCRSTCRSVV